MKAKLIFICTGNKPKGPPREQKPKEQQAKPVDGEGVGEEERAVDDETSMLAGLTGLPLTEDELLFAGLLKTENDEAKKMALTIARRYTIGAMFSCPDGSEVCNMFEKVCEFLLISITP